MRAALGAAPRCAPTRRPRRGPARLVAELAGRRRPAALLVAHGEIVTQREALAGLLADPRVATGILARRPRGARSRSAIRGARGRVVSAASPYHAVHRPTATFLGVLKVAPADRAALAAAAEQLAPLARRRRRRGCEELDRKAALVARRARRRATPRTRRRRARGRRRRRRRGRSRTSRTSADVVLSPTRTRPPARRLAAAPDDVAALLLVGLVRAGAQVGDEPPAPALLGAAAVRGRRRRGRARDRGASTRTGCCSTRRSRAADGFFTTFFVSPYSKYIARWAARRGLTPNQVTTVSVLIGVLAAAAFATGERWGLVAGAVLLQLAFTTDCVDGQLARYTRRSRSSARGWTRSSTARRSTSSSPAWRSARAATGDPVWLLAGAALTLQTARHMSDFSFGGSQREVIGQHAAAADRRRRPTPPAQAAEARREQPPRGRAARRRPRSARCRRACSAPGASSTAARHALGQADGRVPDRRAVRGDLDHRRAVHAARDVHRRCSPGAASPPSTRRPAACCGRCDDAPPPLRSRRRPDRRLPRRRPARARARGAARPRAAAAGAALLLAALLPLLAAVAIGGGDASRAVAAAVLALVVLLGGASSGARPRPTAPLGRAAAAAGDRVHALVWLAALEGPTPTRPRSRCWPRSRSATTTSSTACATAAWRRRRGSARCPAAGTGASCSASCCWRWRAAGRLLRRRRRARRCFVGEASRLAAVGRVSDRSIRGRGGRGSDRDGARGRRRTRLGPETGAGAATTTDAAAIAKARSGDRMKVNEDAASASTATARSSTSRSATSATSGSSRRWSSAATRTTGSPSACRRSSAHGLKVELVYNPKALEWNNAYSLWCAREAFAEGVLLANGDTVHPASVEETLLEARGPELRDRGRRLQAARPRRR